MNCFNKMKQQGRVIDEGVRKLEKTWESPHFVMSGYGLNPEEASKNLENFLTPIKEINEELLEDIKPRTEYVEGMERFLGECRSIFNELKEQCDDIDTLLTEYGYVSLNEEDNGSEVDDLETSILSLKSMESLTICSPGNLSFQEENEDQENESPIQIIKEITPRCIQTPVIKSSKSVQQSDKPKIQRNRNHLLTPLQQFPQEPLYSPYYNHK